MVDADQFFILPFSVMGNCHAPLFLALLPLLPCPQEGISTVGRGFYGDAFTGPNAMKL